MALSGAQKEHLVITQKPIPNNAHRPVMNLPIRILPVVIIVLLGYCLSAMADPMYVVDIVKLGVRSKPDKNEKAIYIIETADAVEVIQSQGQWALIKTDNQRQGWVLKSYLTFKPPLRFQYQKMTALNHQLQDGLALAEEKQREFLAAKEELETQVASLNSQIAQADRQPNLKPTESAVYRKLKTENERLTAELAELEAQAESDKGFLNITQRDYLFFFTGTFVFLMGLLIGYVARKKRRKSLLG